MALEFAIPLCYARCSMKSSRFTLSLLAFAVPLGATWFFLNPPQRLPEIWARVAGLVEEIHRDEARCDAFLAQLRDASSGELRDETAARALLGVLERHPGASPAAQAVHGLVLDDAVAHASSSVPPRLARDLGRVEPFCALPDFFVNWRKLVDASVRIPLKREDRSRVIALGVGFVRSTSGAPTRARIALLQASTLQALADLGWVSIPRTELRRMADLARRLRAEDFGRAPSAVPEATVESIRRELKSAEELRQRVARAAERL